MTDLDTCNCMHLVVVHHLTPKRIRTYCTHMDVNGPCRCEKAEVPDGD